MLNTGTFGEREKG